MKHKSKSVPKPAEAPSNEDARALATRRNIDRAFVELIHRRVYDRLRVGDITRKAGVGRSTFYAHYTSKDDLLRSQFQRMVAPLLTLTQPPQSPLNATPLFTHITTARPIYRSLMGQSGSRARAILLVSFERHISHLLFAAPPPFPIRQDIPRPMLTHFIATGLIAVIEFAMDDPAQTPEQLQSHFQKLIAEPLTGPHDR